MKKSRFLFACFFLLILSSCLDTEEKIVLNANNSGMYSVTMDLGRMLQMTHSMGMDKPASGNDENTRKDTTLYLRDLIKDSDKLTAKEKSLYSDGSIHLLMNEAENEMKVIMSTPFKSAADLTEIKNNFSTVMGKLKAFEKAVGQKSLTGEDDDHMNDEDKSANPVGDQFVFKAEKGRITNTIANMDAYKKLVATDSTLGMMTQMTSMMGDFNYRTTIILPKAAKKVEGPGSTISKDKKTIGFITTLTEMLEYPEKVSYKVEY